MSDVWPQELRVNKARDVLHVTFHDGANFDLSAEYLRAHSPSAEVQGHSASQRKTVWGKKLVKIAGMVPTGNYAVRIEFDDGHDTGIFTWPNLHKLGAEFEANWANYLVELDKLGLGRD